MEKRIIKFRAWHKGIKDMLPNVQNHIGNDGWAFGQLLNDDDVEIVQYTGLKDKNGKDVYEGDVMLSDGINGIVIFNEGEFVVLENTHHDDKTTWPIRCWCGDEGEVIGNIHTNPELL